MLAVLADLLQTYLQAIDILVFDDCSSFTAYFDNPDVYVRIANPVSFFIVCQSIY